MKKILFHLGHPAHFQIRTNGKKRIIELGLDSESVAKKVLLVYQKVLNKS
jgi:hypothetical protein